MHRSGTSLVAGLLRSWGADLGPEERLMPPQPDNPVGFGEHLDLNRLNDELLALLGGRWDEPVGVTGRWTHLPELGPLRSRAREIARRDFGHGRPWAWKDPRTCLLLPFWKSVLPEMRYVICVRHPADVAASLRRRNRIPAERAVHLWALHTAAALHHTRGEARLVVFPARLLRREARELDRLRRFAGVPASRARAKRAEIARFVRSGLWHHRTPPSRILHDDDLPPDARLLFAGLRRAAAASAPRTAALEVDLLATAIWSHLGTAEPLREEGRRLEDARRAAVEAGNAALAAAREAADAQKAEAAREVESLRAAERQLRLDHEAAISAAQEASRRLREEYEAALAAADRTARERLARVESLEDQLERSRLDAESRVGAIEAARAEAEARSAALESTIDEVRRHLENVTRRAAQLEAELARMTESRDAVARSLQEVQATVGWRALERYRRARERVLARSRLLREGHQALMDRLRRTPPARPAPAPPAVAEPAPTAPPATTAASEPVPVPEAWRAGAGGPPVVVVIPHWNRRDHLSLCLSSLFAHTRYPKLAVCVVDQASSDGSAEYLASLGDRVHVISPSENLGFVRACNLAVSRFPDWDVVFLNNDTRVTEGWLERLAATAAASPSIGLVGARLVYPDGRLQEAGSQLFRDGSARAWGRLESASDPRFSERRVVDYCSAAALYVKREVLDRCGPFDERYAPGYYEDADLAMAARAAGYETLYEPGSVVVHLEYGSSRPDEARDRMERNRRLFVEKWGAALASQPASIWEAPGRGRQSVLVVGNVVPAPDRSARGSRLFHLLRQLALEFDVSYALLTDSPADDYPGSLERSGIHVFRPGHARAVGVETLDLEAILRSNAFSPVVCSAYEVAAPLLPVIRRASPRSAVVVDACDAPYLCDERAARLSGSADLAERARRTLKAELDVYGRADEVVTVTAADRAILAEQLTGTPVSVLPTIHPTCERIAPRGERRDLLLLGSFSHRPDVEAALFLCREVYPSARAQIPDLRVHIVGESPPPELLALHGAGIRVHGYVPSLRDQLASRLVSVAPLRSCSGMNARIGQAMSHGLPVVTTPIGAEALELAHGSDVLVADTASGLAGEIVRLHEDEELWERLSTNGVSLARSWSPAAIGPRLSELVRRHPLDAG